MAIRVIVKEWIKEANNEDIFDHGGRDSKEEGMDISDDDHSESENTYSRLLSALRQNISPWANKMEVNMIHQKNWAKPDW